MKIYDNLKLAATGLPVAAIAARAGISRTTVYDALERCKDIRISTAQAIIDACAELKKEGRK